MEGGAAVMVTDRGKMMDRGRRETQCIQVKGRGPKQKRRARLHCTGAHHWRAGELATTGARLATSLHPLPTAPRPVQFALLLMLDMCIVF